MKTKAYTANRRFGIGEVISENNTFYHVVFSDGTEKDLLKSLINLMTIEEAEEQIEMWENNDSERELKSERIQKDGIAAHHKMEEINRLSSLNCRNSSMR